MSEHLKMLLGSADNGGSLWEGIKGKRKVDSKLVFRLPIVLTHILQSSQAHQILIISVDSMRHPVFSSKNILVTPLIGNGTLGNSANDKED